MPKKKKKEEEKKEKEEKEEEEEEEEEEDLTLPAPSLPFSSQPDSSYSLLTLEVRLNSSGKTARAPQGRRVN
ncbi:hypothetical protein EYF80_050036 [Liparis tanakae]|uniref:Uncharacterized protein n=1 Tax=Liparis tanakae TaxID=230148 RepID=A0A4Z2FFS1_9TELE|nr:hypothetical protein EYF80_050036 [Liparis tanakae]